MNAPQSDFVIEPLADHDCGVFCSEVEPLDRYLKERAGQDLRKNVALPFVLVTAEKRIIGYYTLSAAALKSDDLPSEFVKTVRLPHYQQLPATRIGRLAVDSAFRGRGLANCC